MKKVFVFDYPTPELIKEYVKDFDEGNNREDYYKDEAIKNYLVCCRTTLILRKCWQR